MIKRGKRFVQTLIERARYRLLPKWLDYLTTLANQRASKMLAAAGAKRFLVDNTILAHGVTHKTAWVSTGKVRWGDHEIDTGFAARIPVHDDNNQGDAARSVRYLPSIVSLARQGNLVLATSRELQDETLTQPIGRFNGYGYFDLSLFKGVKFEVIPDPEYSLNLGWPANSPSAREQRLNRLATKEDPLYLQLLSVLGSKNSQDAWHIVTAERNDCYCFLTMDFRLIRNIRAQAKNKVIEALKTRVLSPEELGKEFDILPISPRLFSYHHASFPVVHQRNRDHSGPREAQ